MREEKTWRMTEQEFLQKVDNYIICNFPEVQRKFNEREFKDLNHKEIGSLLSLIKEEESKITKDEIPDVAKIRKLKVNAICKSGEGWKWSLVPQDPNEIMFKILLDKYFDQNNICISYICGLPGNVSEDMLEDIVFINSELFGFEYWDDYNVTRVTDIISKDVKFNAFNDITELSHSALIHPQMRQRAIDILQKYYNDKERKINTLKGDRSLFEREIVNHNMLISRLEAQYETANNILSDYKIESGKDTKYYLDIIKDIKIKVNEKYINSFIDTIWENIPKLFKNGNEREDKVLLLVTLIKEGYSKAISKSKTDIKSCQHRIKIIEKKLTQLQEGTENKIVLTDRVDWKNVWWNQTLSEPFKEKYLQLFKLSLQDINEEE